MVVRVERRGFSAWAPWNFRAATAELPCGHHGTSARAGTDLPCGRAQIFRADGQESSVQIQFENGGNQKANYVPSNAKGSRNTPQGSFEISL